ncbi:hypothetical protein [Methylocapsa sp. S129]|uniref:hypothetical protein n=1 Tax=Methylocapsa sp. S129 TaxID=1641869 RepID=UPI00131DFEB8|nr:hypothetical protein [Methylocapsa sp. S129]
MTYVDAMGRLLCQLEKSARSGEGAQLSPQATALLIAALDAQSEGASQSQKQTGGPAFRIALGGDKGEADELLGQTRDISIARAMFDAAAQQYFGQKVRLCLGPRIVEETP